MIILELFEGPQLLSVMVFTIAPGKPFLKQVYTVNSNITQGALLVLVVLRTIQYNMTKIRVSIYSYQQCYTRCTVGIGCTEDITVQYDQDDG